MLVRRAEHGDRPLNRPRRHADIVARTRTRYRRPEGGRLSWDGFEPIGLDLALAAGPSEAGRPCTGASDDRRCRAREPCSTSRPPYMTTTRSATPATIPRSCEISRSVMPISACSRRAGRGSAPGWSRPGQSSARRRSTGRAHRRGRSRSSPAVASRQTAGAGTAGRSWPARGSPRVRVVRSPWRGPPRPCRPRCRSSDSVIWRPTVSTPLRRTSDPGRSSRSDDPGCPGCLARRAWSTRFPRGRVDRASPASLVASAGSAARAVMLFPDPNSPTMATVSPR